METNAVRPIPAYLTRIYESSNFPRLNMSLQEFLHYNYIVYKLAPAGGRAHLSYEEWLDGFAWEETEQRARTA